MNNYKTLLAKLIQTINILKNVTSTYPVPGSCLGTTFSASFPSSYSVPRPMDFFKINLINIKIHQDRN